MLRILLLSGLVKRNKGSMFIHFEREVETSNREGVHCSMKLIDRVAQNNRQGATRSHSSHAAGSVSDPETEPTFPIRVISVSQ